jgi:hypothetical protein
LASTQYSTQTKHQDTLSNSFSLCSRSFGAAMHASIPLSHSRSPSEAPGGPSALAIASTLCSLFGAVEGTLLSHTLPLCTQASGTRPEHSLVLLLTLFSLRCCRSPYNCHRFRAPDRDPRSQSFQWFRIPVRHWSPRSLRLAPPSAHSQWLRAPPPRNRSLDPPSSALLSAPPLTFKPRAVASRNPRRSGPDTRSTSPTSVTHTPSACPLPATPQSPRLPFAP